MKGRVFLTAAKRDPTKPGNKLYRLTDSTSNTHRSGGGTSQYRLECHPVHFLCREIEAQLGDHLHSVQVDVDKIPAIRDYYINEVANKLGRLHPDERAEIKQTLKQINEE